MWTCPASEVLGLRVTDGDDGSSYDHADWADAAIDMKDGAPAPVALTPYETFSLKTKGFAVNFQVGDDGRLYQIPVGGRDAEPQIETRR